MSSSNPVNPNNPQPPNTNPAASQPNTPPSTPPSGSAPPPPSGGKTTQFLGMTFDPEQTKQLNNIMIQNIGNQIQDYNDKSVKAIKNSLKISEGEDPDD